MPPLDPQVEERIIRWRRENLGRLLVRTFEMFQEDVLQRLRARGFMEVERSDLTVLRNLDLEGNRITEIAERAGLSKQTIGPLVHELEEKGILRVDRDPTDGRAKVVRFTDRGLEGFETAMEVFQETVARYTACLGRERMEQLHSALRDLLERFEGPPRVPEGAETRPELGP
ncbi:MAG: MarR family winged helix-turn-helix transcriptional regulator [Gemmatimonadota bacterium]